MHQPKIVSIFLVWIWANISLQKSIPECFHSSPGLEACTSKCFLKWWQRGDGALQMRSHYTWWSIPCVSARFYFTTPLLPPPHTHSLFSELKPLKIIGMWKNHFYQFQSLRLCWRSHTHTHTHTEEESIYRWVPRLWSGSLWYCHQIWNFASWSILGFYFWGFLTSGGATKQCFYEWEPILFTSLMHISTSTYKRTHMYTQEHICDKTHSPSNSFMVPSRPAFSDNNIHPSIHCL